MCPICQLFRVQCKSIYLLNTGSNTGVNSQIRRYINPLITHSQGVIYMSHVAQKHVRNQCIRFCIDRTPDDFWLNKGKNPLKIIGWSLMKDWKTLWNTARYALNERFCYGFFAWHGSYIPLEVPEYLACLKWIRLLHSYCYQIRF